MGSMERREREKQTVRERILDAARELFVAHGYEAVTMRQIARKIEYTPTAIYFHFKDKQELLNELCSRDFLAMAAMLQQLGKVRDPLQRLYEMGCAYMEFGLKFPNHYRMMFMTPRPIIRTEAMTIRKGNPAEDAYEFLRTTVSECFISGSIRSEYKDPELVAQMLWAAVHGVTALHIAMAHDDWFQWRPVRQLADATLDTVLRGLTAKDPGAKIRRMGAMPSERHAANKRTLKVTAAKKGVKTRGKNRG